MVVENLDMSDPSRSRLQHFLGRVSGIPHMFMLLHYLWAAYNKL